MSSKLLDSFVWRRAVKRFALPRRNVDKISATKLSSPPIIDNVNIHAVLEAARLAPTANGVQPFNIHVIVNQEVKERLKEVSYGQHQVVESTHLLVFSAINDPSIAINRVINDKSDPTYVTSLRNTFLPMSKETFFLYASNQTHIALGFSLAAAADLRIASCPMGGFEPEKVRTVLNIPTTELPVAYLAVGTMLEGVEGEKLANPFPKLRLESHDIVKYY